MGELLSIFTFHYVSIKSVAQEEKVITNKEFTFHYVSIKSNMCLKLVLWCFIPFTFHYVSIKS